ncbi:MAG: beta-glucoside-specific PTS transporter subunit IIABC [Clostridiales bacterium]|nr:beta-glucoside-specific PTS transporter subunit IIABC [Clostridiales bacterium]
MALDYVETSKKIIEAVGGVSNIASATNCMTRLRLVLNDESKADDKKVEKIKGVKSVIKQGGQYQIVIGNEVSNLFKEFKTMGNFGAEGGSSAPKKAEGNIIQRLFGFISGCMTPMLPAMLGCGMMKVVLTLLTTFAGLSTEGSTYIILNAMGDCFFTFLPIFLAFNIAKKMDGSPMLFMAVAAAMVYPDLVTLMGGGSLELGTFLGMDCTYLFGIPVICSTYTSSVLPMLLMAPVMKWVEDFADRVSPNVLKSFLKPLIFLIICVPVALIILGPLGNIIGNALSGVFNTAYNACGWLTIGVMSAIMPFIVMTGMHYALVPLMTINLTTLGFDALVITTMFCSNLAQGGASLGVGLKSKNTETKSEGIACGISAVVAGVTEPAMYGINLRYGRPMAAAVIAAGISGLWCGITGVVAYVAGGSPSIMTLIQFIGGDNPMSGVIFGAIGAVLSIGISFTLSFIMYKDPVEEEEEDEAPAEDASESAPKPLVQTITLSAPMTGEVVKLADVPDQVFASGALGEGVAIVPTVGKVVAPCDAVVSATMDTKHAVGLTTPEGLELLIHVGLNTVELNGKFYDYKVKEGDNVKEGDTLIEFDIDGIKAAGYQLHTPVLVTNSDEYVSIKPVDAANIQAGQDLMTVV